MNIPQSVRDRVNAIRRRVRSGLTRTPSGRLPILNPFYALIQGVFDASRGLEASAQRLFVQNMSSDPQAYAQEMRKRLSTLEILSRQVQTGGFFAEAKIASDKFQYVTMPAVSLVSKSFGDFADVIQTYMGAKEQIKFEYGNIGSMVGTGLGTMAGDFIGDWMFRAGVGMAAAGTATVVGAIPGWIAGGATILASFIPRIVLPVVGGFLGRKIGEAVVGDNGTKYAEKMARGAFASKMMEKAAALLPVWNQAKGNIAVHDISGGYSGFTKGLRKEFGSRKSLEFMGIKDAEAVALASQVSSTQRVSSGKDLFNRTNLLGNFKAVYGIDANTTFVNISKVGGGDTTKELSQSIEKFYRAVAGGEEMRGAYFGLVQNLAAFTEMYKHANYSTNVSDMASYANTFRSTLAPSKGNEVALEETKSFVGLIDKIAGQYNTSPLLGKIIENGGMSGADLLHGSGSREGTNRLLSGVAAVFNIYEGDTAKLSEDGTSFDMLGQSALHTNVMVRQLGKSGEEGGLGLSPGESFLLIRAVLMFQKGGFADLPSTPDGADKYFKSLGIYKDTLQSLVGSMARTSNMMHDEALKLLPSLLAINNEVMNVFINQGKLIGKYVSENLNKILAELGYGSRFVGGSADFAPLGSQNSAGQALATASFNLAATGNYVGSEINTNSKGFLKYASNPGSPLKNPAFLKKVVEVAGRLKIDPNALLAIMAKESSLRSNNVNINPDTGYGHSGFIQISDNNLRDDFNMSRAQFLALSDEDELDYVESYLTSRMKGHQVKHWGDFYIAVAGPAYLGKDDDWSYSGYNRDAPRPTLKNGKIGKNAYDRNPLWDIDGDGKVQTRELRQYVDRVLGSQGSSFIDPNFVMQQIRSNSDGTNSTASVMVAQSTAFQTEGDLGRLLFGQDLRMSSSIGSSEPFRGGWKHEGIDLVVGSGTPIQAPADGIILMNTTGEFLGYYITTRSKYGDQEIDMVYGHLREPSHLGPGSAFKKGDVIAISGNTGKSTGAHLHFQAIISSRTMNYETKAGVNNFWSKVQAYDEKALGSFEEALLVMTGRKTPSGKKTTTTGGGGLNLASVRKKFPGLVISQEKVGNQLLLTVKRKTKTGSFAVVNDKSIIDSIENYIVSATPGAAVNESAAGVYKDNKTGATKHVSVVVNTKNYNAAQVAMDIASRYNR